MMQILRKISLPALCLILIMLFSGRGLDAAEHAVVLQYHHFGDDTPPSTSVTLEQFDSHLKYLAANDYTVWHLEKIVSYLKDNKELPERCVAITIDDAYISVYEEAWPRLRKYGYPFTVFVPTEGVRKRIKSYMTWDQMREIRDKSDVVFASHSHTHDYLVRKFPGESENEWIDRVISDINTSLEILGKELGPVSTLFAYPYGEYNTALEQIVMSLGLTGVGQQSGSVWSGSDFAVLPRFPMASGYAEINEFITKVRSLPLPVTSIEPRSPIIADDAAKPVLRLTIAPGDYYNDSLACYAGGLGRINVRWVDRGKGMVEIEPDKDLPRGRSRYNCTARHKKENRYFWYSHLWIRQ